MSAKLRFGSCGFLKTREYVINVIYKINIVYTQSYDESALVCITL